MAKKKCIGNHEYASISANQMDTMDDKTDSNVKPNNMAANSGSEESENTNRKSVAAADCSQSNPDATKKNTNTISDPNKLTNSELNTANIEEKRLSCL